MAKDQQPKSKSKPKLRIFKVIGGCIAILLVGGVLIAAGGYLWWQSNVISPNSSDNSKVTIQVTEGDTLLSVAEDLNKQGVLKSMDAFRIYLRLYPLTITTIQQGKYEIPKNLNIAGVLELLAKGPIIETVKITIIEGLRYDEVADAIEDAYAEEGEVFDKQRYIQIVESPSTATFSAETAAFLSKVKPTNKSLEGLLFPDTYTVALDAGALDLIELQLTTLKEKMESAGLDLDDAGRLDNYYEVINLASIVQREAKRYEDMQMVSDVFLKRLEDNWVLGSDATILYPYRRWTPPPTAAEIAKETPYNSYKVAGLPTTPICNPGIDAIKSVINHIPNPYYYFITDRDGIKRYAETFAGHERNIATYGLAF